MKHAPRLCVLAAALAMTTTPAIARAFVAEGQPAPAFTKFELDSPIVGQNTSRSLNDYAGKVIFLFMMAYN